MAKRNRELVGMLESLLDAARSGEIDGMFAVLHAPADDSYDSCYSTDDMGDMLVQVRTEVIRAQLPVDVIEQAERPN